MLSNQRQELDGLTYYYEERRGLLVIRDVRDKDGRYIQTEYMVIPWAKIRESLARKSHRKSTEGRR